MIRTDELQGHQHQDEPVHVEHVPVNVEPVAGHSIGRELPMQLIAKYVDKAMLRAESKQYPDGDWYAEIPGFPGVWASQSSEAATLEELRETLQEWVLLKIEDRDRDLPVLDLINLNVL
jgi:predicted RNase H-like HicB family nuclease